MSTASELYEVNLVSSSKLKLRATAYLADGSEAAVFDACVLFHDAARLERRAVEALTLCPPEARLAGSIEECWCLLEGHDPHAAADVWSRILDEVASVTRATADSMLARLRPRYDRAIKDFVGSIQSRPVLSRIGYTQVLVPSSAAEQKSTLHELQALLKRYPGVPGLWGGLSRLAEVAGNEKLAWHAVDRAGRLSPENSGIRALSLQMAAKALSPAEADQYLSKAFSELGSAEAEVCLMYAFSEIILVERSSASRNERWKRALTAVEMAFPKTHSEWMRKNLKGVRLYLEAALAKRKADPDLLYRAGLGRLAATSGGKPIDALRADATARVSAMFASGAAA